MTAFSPLHTQQFQATDPKQSCWVMASAGTGKTKMLVDRILRLLLLGTDPKRILCITYTKAAANEITERLQKILKSWSCMEEYELEQTLFQLEQSLPSKQSLQQARCLFSLYLENPLAPQTIHSFCQKILGQFSFEAGLQPEFTIMEENDAFLLREQSIKRILYKSCHQKDLSILIQEMSEFHLKNCIHEALSRRDRILPHASKNRKAYFEKKFPKDALYPFCIKIEELNIHEDDGNGVATKKESDSKENIKTHTIKNKSLRLSPQTLKIISFLSKLIVTWGPKTLQKKATAVLNAFSCIDLDEQVPLDHHHIILESHIKNRDDNQSPDPFEIETDTLKSSYIQNRHYDTLENALFDLFLTSEGKRRSKASTKDLLKEYPSFQEDFDRISQGLESLFIQRTINTLLEINEAFDHIYSEVKAHYELEKTRQNSLDFDDLIEKTHTLLKGYFPWILYKLEGGFDHILIDEAQDTSPFQWEILKELTLHFFEDSAKTKTPRTLFIVGDSKQSIYSFQGADPTLYKEIKSYFESLLKEAGYMIKTYYLDICYRCTPPILALVDQWSDSEKRTHHLLLDQKSYHTPYRKNDFGVVHSWGIISKNALQYEKENQEISSQSSQKQIINTSFEKIDDDNCDSQSWELFSMPCIRETHEDKLALMIAKQIKSLLTSQKILASTGEIPKPDDIFILLRRRGTLMTAISKALTHHNIIHSCQDQGSFLEHLYVRDFLTFLRFLDCPYDDLNLACLLKSPFLGVSENDLMRLCHNRTSSLWVNFSQDKKLQDHSNFLHYFVDLHPQKDLYTLCHHFLHLTYERSLLIFDHVIRGYLSSLLTLILKSQEQGYRSPGEALNFIEKHSRTLKQNHTNGVRIMTIHGAKGLESPIVILGDAGDKTIATHNNILFSPHFHILRHTSKVLNELKTSEKSALKAESDRLLYVALTRARDHLYITGIDQEEEESWYTDLRSFLEEVRDMKKEPCISKSKSFANQNEKTEDILFLEEHYERYSQKLYKTHHFTPHETNHKEIFTVKGQHHVFPSKKENIEISSTKKGIQAHKILELLGTIYNPTIPLSKFNQPIKTSFQNSIFKKENIEQQYLESNLSELLTDHLLKKMQLSHEFFKDFTENNIAAIVELYSTHVYPLLSHAKLFFELSVKASDHRIYRLDCVAISQKNIVIIDLKTGNRNQNSHHKHQKQIETYATILQHLYPTHSIEGLLLYTHDQNAIRWNCSSSNFKNKVHQ